MGILNTQDPQRLEFRGCLDTFCHDLAAYFPRERNERGGEGGARRILIDPPGEAHIELDDVRSKGEDVLHSPRWAIGRACFEAA